MNPPYLAAAVLAIVSGLAFAQPAANPFRPSPAGPVAAMPQPATMPSGPQAAPAPAKPQAEEEVQASRIGTVNGLRVYRGENTYLFEKAAEKDIVRRLVSSGAAQPATEPAGATPAAMPNGLPSSVGRPAAKK